MARWPPRKPWGRGRRARRRSQAAKVYALMPARVAASERGAVDIASVLRLAANAIPARKGMRIIALRAIAAETAVGTRITALVIAVAILPLGAPVLSGRSACAGGEQDSGDQACFQH